MTEESVNVAKETEESVNVAKETEEKVIGTCTAAMQGYINALTALVSECEKFDENKFKKKADLLNCSKTIRQGVVAVKKSMGEYTKAINTAAKERKEVFEGTPEERRQKAKEKIKKMEEALAKAKAKLAGE